MSKGVIIQHTQVLGSFIYSLHAEFEEPSGSVGGVLDLGSNGHKFQTRHQWSRCVVSMSMTLYPLLTTGLTQEDRKWSDINAKLLTGM